MTRHLPLAAAGIVGVLLLAACVPNATPDATVVAVDSSADHCAVETPSVASGTVTFQVTNSGDQITEFYLLGEDGVSIVSEVENIAPGSSRELTVVVQPGSYFTQCKPGMVGAGVGKAAFTVTGDPVPVADSDGGLSPPTYIAAALFA